jgi:DNA-binding TFAR19-related protein (PDSD5 family)
MATTAAGTTEHRESRGQEKTGKSEIVIVDLDEPQSPQQIRRLRKGKGKLATRVERIVNELIEAGTVKSTAQPVVIVVRESMSPLSFLAQD